MRGGPHGHQTPEKTFACQHLFDGPLLFLYAERLFANVRADVVIHTAGSRLKRIFGQGQEIIRGGKISLYIR
jgi:hypothetical protein